jgi:hypothetical protein
MKHLVLWVIVLAAGLASLAQAVPCIMGDHTQIAAGGEGCMTMPHHAEGKDHDCTKSSVQDCFDLHALAPEATVIKAASSEHPMPAILPATVKPVALLGQKVTRPPPEPADSFTPTHEFLASLSRWLI